MDIGKKIWLFGDGDLPPQGNSEPLGHEALMITNAGDIDAEVLADVLFQDKEPKEGIVLRVPARRVICFRLDYPIGDQAYRIPSGQYALALRSNVPVVAVFGRLDRRKRMSYYSVGGFSV